MKKIAGLLIILLLLTGCAGNLKDGVAWLKEGNYEKAVDAFEKDIKKAEAVKEALLANGFEILEVTQMGDWFSYVARKN